MKTRRSQRKQCSHKLFVILSDSHDFCRRVHQQTSNSLLLGSIGEANVESHDAFNEVAALILSRELDLGKTTSFLNFLTRPFLLTLVIYDLGR